jgi:GNAT superfamily N-acetyltransferase
VISIWRIKPEDGDILRHLRLAALSDAPFAFASTYTDKSARSLVEWGDRARAWAEGFDGATFFAPDSEEPVGLVGGYNTNSVPPMVELVSMWTAPQVRGMGVARLLIRVLLAWAGAGGADAVGVWVTEGNDPADNLYTAVGFVQVPGRERSVLGPASKSSA